MPITEANNAQAMVDVGVDIANAIGVDSFSGEGETSSAIRSSALDLVARTDVLANIVNDVQGIAEETVRLFTELMNGNDMLKEVNLTTLEGKEEFAGSESYREQYYRGKSVITNLSREKGEASNIQTWGPKVGNIQEANYIVPGIKEGERSAFNATVDQRSSVLDNFISQLKSIPELPEILSGGTPYALNKEFTTFNQRHLKGVFQPSDFEDGKTSLSNVKLENNDSLNNMAKEINGAALDKVKKSEEVKTEVSKAEDLSPKDTPKVAPVAAPVASGGGGGGASFGGGGGGGGASFSPNMTRSAGKTGGGSSTSKSGKSGIDIKNKTKDLASEEEIDIDKMIEEMLGENASKTSDPSKSIESLFGNGIGGGSGQSIPMGDTSVSSKALQQSLAELEHKNYNLLYDSKGEPIGYSTDDKSYVFDPESGNPIEMKAVDSPSNDGTKIFTDPNTGQQYRIRVEGEDSLASTSESSSTSDATSDSENSEDASKTTSKDSGGSIFI